MASDDSIEVFRQELHAYGLRAIMDEARAVMGVEAMNAILKPYGVTVVDLDDPEAWVSLHFIESLLGDIARNSPDPFVLDRAARQAMTQKYLGPIYTFVRAFGDVYSTFDKIAKGSSRFNKTGTFAIERLAPARCTLRFTPVENCRERTAHMCRIRRLQFATVPTIFDLPPAEVSDPKCLARGDDCCFYDITWRAAPSHWASRFGSAIGLGVGLAIGHFGLLSAPMTAALAVMGAIAGWSIARVRELRQVVAERVRDLNEHQEALISSMRANEERFAEVLEAKAEVEKKVELRTVELRGATQRLSETLLEVQALDRAKTDFFNNVSHELRSPLTLILAPLEDIVAGRQPPGGERTAHEGMRRNAHRLLQLINQLLDLAKIDAGEMKIAPVSTDLGDLVRSAVLGFDAAARLKGVELSVQAPDGVSLLLDPSWIESAVTNLLANALRVTPAGKAVRISIEDHGADVWIAIADDGPGIAPEDQKKVFERFAQGDASKRVVGGTGIGLALVRETARLHGGEVRLVSALGAGATFTLRLPRRADIVPAAEPLPAAKPLQRAPLLILEEMREANTGSERSGPGLGAPLAFVVEDNPELRGFIADVLAVRYRVRTFTQATAALVAAGQLKPDVVVSDVAMPEMNGYELCRALRAGATTQSIPILLVTARAEVANVLEGFEAGASDYVLKPFHGRELLARVDVHVRLQRTAQELALRERHAMLGVLAASVAHQVRNPLTTLISGLPAMRGRLEGKVSATTFELIDLMMDCAGRIESLTGDLMDLSRVDREADGDYRPSDGLSSAVRMVKARIPEGVSVEEKIDGSPVIQGRPGDMNHVFMNLLDNAVRAVGEHGRIRIEGVSMDAAYVIRVADSGAGVDKAIAERIFDPFFTTRPAGEGTGLGLAIANQVVQRCGGSIRVDRADLGGAVFIVEIPTKPSSARPQGVPARDDARLPN